MAFYAAIDIGSNSVRLLVVELRNSELKILKQETITTRLGSDLPITGEISSSSWQKTLKTLEYFKNIREKMGDIPTITVATAAVREASNGRDFIKEVKKIGLEPKIISGEEEAYLSFKGATYSFQFLSPPVVVIDIGGMTTEFAIEEEKGFLVSSYEVGAIRCTPPSKEEIFKTLEPILTYLQKIKAKELIFVGGTVTTIAAIDLRLETYDWKKVHGYRLKRKRIKDIIDYLSCVSLEDRKKIKGLQPQRADIIIGGAAILYLIVDYLQVKEVTISETDLLLGAIFSLSRGEDNAPAS